MVLNSKNPKLRRKLSGVKISKSTTTIPLEPKRKTEDIQKVKENKRKSGRHLIAINPYNEKIDSIAEKYNIPINLVENNVSNIVKLVEENPKLKNSLFIERFPIFLQLNVWKIPKCNTKLIRLELEHSVLDTEDEICLIVPDLKQFKAKDYEQQVEYYQTYLKQRNVTGISKIMTLHQLKSEYDTFELKRGLVELYDMFLVDGRISGKVVHQLGKIFYKKRKIPIPIKMDKSRVKKNIECAKKKVTFQVHSKGDSFMVQFGDNKMTERELVGNVYYAIKDIDEQFPGGINNLKSINIFAQRGSSLPIYMALANPNEIKTPKVKNKKPKLFKDFEGELTTKLNTKVKVKPSGSVITSIVAGENE